MKNIKSFIFHPFLFVFFPIIFIYSNNLQELIPSDLLQPSLYIIVFLAIILFVSKLIFKDWLKVGLITSLVIGLVFSYGYIYQAIAGFTIGGIVLGRHVFMIIPYLLALIVGSYYIFKAKKSFENITKILNVVAITLISVSMLNIGIYMINNNGVETISHIDNDMNSFKDEDIHTHDYNKHMLSLIGEPDYYPDVYYVLFDGYGGTDSLKKDLNYNNTKFVQSLEERGFFVAKHPHSNYPMTFLSIPSTFNMKYLNYFSDTLGIESKDQITPMKLMNNSTSMQILKFKGYKTISFLTSNFEINSDSKLCPGDKILQPNKITAFIAKISLFVYFVNWQSTEYVRDQQLCFFSELPEIHKSSNEPIFVIAHIILPHPPNVFGPNGEHVIPRDTWTVWGDERDKQSYIDTLQYGNLRALEFIDKVLKETKQPPIIIIASDHGTDYGFDWNNPDDIMLKQRYNNFIAIYTPKGKDMLYDTMTPVNTFKIIFNANFNGNYTLLNDSSYWSSYDKPYLFRDITENIKENN